MIVFIERRHLLRFFSPDGRVSLPNLPSIDWRGQSWCPNRHLPFFIQSDQSKTKMQKIGDEISTTDKAILLHCCLSILSFIEEYGCCYCLFRCCCLVMPQVQSRPIQGMANLFWLYSECNCKGFWAVAWSISWRISTQSSVSDPTTAIKIKSLQGLSAPVKWIGK